MTAWLDVHEGTAPLLVAIPHSGTEIPAAIEDRLVSPWIGRKDSDWWVDRLYAFATDLGATTVRTAVSRTVIDVNRDPSGASLYPGQATTELCPTTSFDGEPLYRAGAEPDEADMASRRRQWFDPYHAALQQQLDRLRRDHGAAVLIDAHSIRSRIPRLFDGDLPHLNIGTNAGRSCDPALIDGIAGLCAASAFSHVVDGRFKGGWTTRHHGRPDQQVHAVQIELAMRSYLDEPVGPVGPENWPVRYDPARAEALQAVLRLILERCLAFANR